MPWKTSVYCCQQMLSSRWLKCNGNRIIQQIIKGMLIKSIALSSGREEGSMGEQCATIQEKAGTEKTSKFRESLRLQTSLGTRMMNLLLSIQNRARHYWLKVRRQLWKGQTQRGKYMPHQLGDFEKLVFGWRTQTIKTPAIPIQYITWQ